MTHHINLQHTTHLEEEGATGVVVLITFLVYKNALQWEKSVDVVGIRIILNHNV